ncbi:MAG: SDR family oxidoreductase [Desulfurellaceae bacterium]|nr:SDR family oxidoreductase [Desulfurellaceae bacterium]
MAGLVEGKVALVTGGGSGIGRQACLVFAREGAQVVVCDVAVEGGEETVGQIEQAGGQATFIRADVAQAAEVEALVAKTVETYGRLDCAYNNAGIAGRTARVADDSEQNWERILAINLKGVWLCLKYEIAHMLTQGGGAIVNTASDAGLIGLRRAGAYVASKHGVVGLTKTAALEYAKANIRVNAVCPGPIDTPMLREASERVIDAMATAQPNGRLGQPREIAEAAVWLCSDAASFVTGHPMPVDGGYLAQ